MQNKLDIHALDKMKKEYDEMGAFLVQGDYLAESYVQSIIPGYKHLGSIEELLGYEPENYKLQGALIHDGKIHTIFDAGNCWIGYGVLESDDDFSIEITEGAKRIGTL